MTRQALTPEEVSAALRSWLGARFPGAVTDAHAPERLAGGYDFWVYGLRFHGDGLPGEWTKPMVARIPVVPGRFEMLERETRLQEWVAEHDYPAPAVLELVPPGELFEHPAQVMRRVPGRTMAAAMIAAPWRLRRYARQLAASQAALHRVPAPGWAAEDRDWSIAEGRLRLVRHMVAGDDPPPNLAEALERAERLLPLLATGSAAGSAGASPAASPAASPGASPAASPVVCHGDFHPANLLISAGQVRVIDWTDAGIGDRHADIARTAWVFRLAAVAAPRRAQRFLLGALGPLAASVYLAAYQRELPIDPERLSLWLPLHLLHAWAMAASAERDAVGPADPADVGRAFSPGLAAWAQREFWRSVEDLPG
ncbi:MAG TPA: aminoglycoside phosphotransferase family protein [Streptosporangiaceae bacterium]|jgi:aminoglycoside phosphotransferase (APT) family kinase protein